MSIVSLNLLNVIPVYRIAFVSSSHSNNSSIRYLQFSKSKEIDI